MLAHSVADHLRLIDRSVTILTRSTEALLQATDEVSLLNQICRIAVDVAGYRLAWVGYTQMDAERSITPMAVAGNCPDYVEQISLSWADASGAAAKEPVGRAIRTGRPQVIHNIENGTDDSPWRDGARKHELRSIAALPLGTGDKRLGALVIYADEADVFDPEVTRLMEDLARNLAYGIGALRMKNEHDKAVRALAESEERYRSLIALTPDAILVHSQGTILFANSAAAIMFAAGTTPLPGVQLLDLIAEDFRDTIGRRIAFPPEQRQVNEYRMRRLDGSEFEAEVVSATVTLHGLPARILVIRDVTARKQVQEQMVQTAKLATLGEMAAGLVHELSQPLNVMRLTAEGALLFIERGKASQDWQTEQFQLIADQAQRTAEIIDDIRIFSRRDTSPVQVFDALSAVHSALSVLEGQMRPDEITLTQTLPAAPAPIKGRRVQLEQVIMNLVSNAHHALRDKRENDPDCEWRGQVCVDAHCDNGQLTMVVADNGPGIPAAVRARIFEPFFTTKSAGRGTGLGLSVSFGIINNMGGRLEVTDNAGGGARFVITLPLDIDEPQGQPDDTQSPLCLTGMNSHIMVVEDNRAAAEGMANALREMGCRVTLCSSGNAAWSAFQEDPADVVITDLRMPAGGGEQLVEKLRDYDPLQPIIIVTGHLGATERLSDSLQDDRCAVLKKPVPLSKLADTVARFLQPPAEEEDTCD